MNVLLVYAHPEPRSLNGALKEFAIQRLQAAGHQVQVSDLYAMGWKAAIDAGDSLDRDPAEQDKLRWADALILQFPLWWFSMPAILKGWVDRVYAYGFAYGVGEHSDARWGDRYGEGSMVGKRAMLMVTTGGWDSHYSPRGINGPIEDLLFPIHHGILHCPGFDVLPPFLVHRTSRIDRTRFDTLRDELGKRLDDLWRTEPIAYRKQNGGDYDIPALTLRAEVAPGQVGFAAHVEQP